MKTHKAGHTLRQMRLAQNLTQLDLEKMSHGRLPFVRISRIETGALSKPPMEDLVEYGRLLGLSPNDVANLYGYWSGTEQAPAQEDARLVRLRAALRRLDADEADKLLTMVDFAVALAIAERRG